MFNPPERPDWPSLLRPLAEASTALGRLALALERTPLHRAWLWRETVRASTTIAQIAGHRAQAERLAQSLIGVPLDPAEEPCLAAARRMFLNAAPLFRAGAQTDSNGEDSTLALPLWEEGTPTAPDQPSGRGGMEKDGEGGEGVRLLALARDLAVGAGRGTLPPLLDLLLTLRHDATVRRLPASLSRLALPLALHEAGLVPKAAPGLLAGRLPLGLSRASGEGLPITQWLIRALDALAKEATGSERRLADLERRHRAWQARLAETGLRGHARAPKLLDLLTATPALSTPLAARHLGCSPQGAGLILRQFQQIGILTEATARSRWKIFLATDLVPKTRGERPSDEPLALSDPLPDIDRAAIARTLDGLFQDLERLQKRTRAALAT